MVSPRNFDRLVENPVPFGNLQRFGLGVETGGRRSAMLQRNWVVPQRLLVQEVQWFVVLRATDGGSLGVASDDSARVTFRQLFQEGSLVDSDRQLRVQGLVQLRGLGAKRVQVGRVRGSSFQGLHRLVAA